jgi:hypothetical protein
MPPRYAYWTILIDGKATAFRAREREELLPTFNQLARKNADIVMRYFARGRLWDNPEQAQWASRNPEVTRKEPRDRAWRPGGQHKDPRTRFEKKTDRRDRPFESKNRKPFTPTEQKPFQSKERKPYQSGERKPFQSTDRKPLPSADRRPLPSADRKPFMSTDRKPRFDSRGGKRPGTWSRPPKRKPR